MTLASGLNCGQQLQAPLIMPKRKQDILEEISRPPKRVKALHDRLSDLSDELLLRILVLVPVETLAICQRVSQKIRSIAGDSQIWRAAYYDRFVRPRLTARRNLGPSRSRLPADPSLPSNWLDERTLLKRGTNWKRQYKLRRNWSIGSCNVNEIQVAQPPVSPLIARLQSGIVFTVDQNSGLRTWAYKHDRELLAHHNLSSAIGKPTCLAPDTQEEQSGALRIAIGCDNGAFALYSYQRSSRSITSEYEHAESSHGAINASALAFPHLVTLTKTNTLTFYKFSSSQSEGTTLDPPQSLTTVQSSTVWAPLSLSLRTRTGAIVACIAYAVPSFYAGWSTGIQELHLSNDGIIMDSRLASSTPEGFASLTKMGLPRDGDLAITQHPQQFSRPTSLSYSHPYMLVTHADNTLTLYLVNSTKDGLHIGPGKRLWGHTSSVFGAQVGRMGKAVSVSSRGDEIRVWELEGATFLRKSSRHYNDAEHSVPIRLERRPTSTGMTNITEAIARRGSGLGLALVQTKAEESITRGWVGFDEENVVVVKEQAAGNHALAIYDFT